MFGLDNSSGVSVMPPLSPKNNQNPLWFSEGGNGQAVSYPGQDWFNAVQAELINAVVSCGIGLDKEKLNQLAEAFATKLNKNQNLADLEDVSEALSNLGLMDFPARSGITASFGLNGWVSIPAATGGVVKNFIIQWGQAPVAGTGVVATVTYPITFPNAAFQVVSMSAGTPMAASSATRQFVTNSTPLGRTSFDVMYGGDGSSISMLFRYIAIGY